MATTRMELDVEGKSIIEILTDNIGVLFDEEGKMGPRYESTGPDPPEGTFITNKYFAEAASYVTKYMSEQGDSFVDPPTFTDVQNQAVQGYVLGQILGGEITIGNRIKNEAAGITRSYLEQLGNSTENQFLKDYFDSLLKIVVGANSTVSAFYVPGWQRPAEYRLTKKPLHLNLSQNLLLPPGVVGNNTGNGEGPAGLGDNNATFQSLYTRNRSGQAGGVNTANPIFNNGKLAGAPINLMQEPLVNRNALLGPDWKNKDGVGLPVSTEDTVIFSYEKDDGEYLTHEKLQGGYRSNGPSTQTQPNVIEPAVVDIAKAGSSEEGLTPQAAAHQDALTVIGTGMGQYFPFTFSTVNKKNGRIQICFLQAAINTLSESYNPTWASKHFFGRSEQVHTYTFTDRTVDLSFMIYVDEMRQLQNIYERVLWLAQQTYPDYDDLNRLSAGPIISMRVGDLFQQKAGIIRSLSYDWMFMGAGGKWEVTSGIRMPMGCQVTMSYQIIHDYMPTRDMDFYGGPAGGLNAGTQRGRLIKGAQGAGGAFEKFEESNVEEIGIARENRFLPMNLGTDLNDERYYLDAVQDKNYAGPFAEYSLKAAEIPTAAPIDDPPKSVPPM